MFVLYSVILSIMPMQKVSGEEKNWNNSYIIEVEPQYEQQQKSVLYLTHQD